MTFKVRFYRLSRVAPVITKVRLNRMYLDCWPLKVDTKGVTSVDGSKLTRATTLAVGDCQFENLIHSLSIFFMANKTIRVVTRGSDGNLRTKDFENFDPITELHDQVGIDDCSTDLSLRGMPIFKGLVGPMSESATVVRYESPDVFESLTKEWSKQKVRRRRRRSTTEAEPAKQETPIAVPAPNFSTGTHVPTPGTPSAF